MLLAAGPAQATSSSSHTVTLSLTLAAATYTDDDSDASGNLDTFGSSDISFGTFETGTGSQSDSASFTVNGVAPGDPVDFSFGVGDTIEATLTADTSADGVGSEYSRFQTLVLSLGLEDVGDGSRNILPDFVSSYTQSFDLTNTAAGDLAAALFDADAAITNFESFDDYVVLVDGQNFGNLDADTDISELMDSGSFSLLMDTENGGAPASLVDITIDVGSNSHINVPEPAGFSLLALGTAALLAVRHLSWKIGRTRA